MVLIDTNILLDVFNKRQPHFMTSASVANRVTNGRLEACVAAHSVTTLHYLVERTRGRVAAMEAARYTLKFFKVATVGPDQFDRALALNWPDFEDAVVAAAAESAGCTSIVTRNVVDFRYSPVRAVAPEELVIDEVHESFVRRYG